MAFALPISPDDKVYAGTPYAVSRVGVNKPPRLHDLTVKVCGLRHHSFCFAHLLGKRRIRGPAASPFARVSSPGHKQIQNLQSRIRAIAYRGTNLNWLVGISENRVA